MQQRVPKFLQGILWSVDVSDLDSQKDKSYIINQVLSLGTLDELAWLGKTYSKSILRQTFIEQPDKIYTPSAFNFCKLLLNLTNLDLPDDRYVKTLPRNLRS